MSKIPTLGPSKRKMPCWLAGSASSVLATSFLCAVSGSAAAALHDRGNGRIYDDALDVTWVQDVNLAASQSFGVSGIAADGTMNWYTAQAWIASMNSFGGTGYLGFNDWRLPRVRPLNGVAFVYEPTFTGMTDVGANISAPGSLYGGSTASEVAFLHYNSLSNSSQISIDGAANPAGGFVNQGPFTNWGEQQSDLDPQLQPFIWLDSRWPTPSGTTCVVNPGVPVTGDQLFDGCTAWVFNVAAGFQAGAGASNFPASAWALRDGDVSPIPEPAITTLLTAGLASLLTKRHALRALRSRLGR